ncbi:hypothetical protein UG53_03735, partial [Vibrio sp. S512-13]
VKDDPGARTVNAREKIEKTEAGSIDKALQFVPGIKFQEESGRGVLPNISVRGLKASRSGHAQFLMDGGPLTLAPYGHTGQSIFPCFLYTSDAADELTRSLLGYLRHLHKITSWQTPAYLSLQRVNGGSLSD